MHDAAASFTHEKARKFDKEIKIENKSYKTKPNVINLKQEMQAFFHLNVYVIRLKYE